MNFSKNIFLIFCMMTNCILNAQKSEIELWNGNIPNSIQNTDYKEVRVFQDSVLSSVSKVTTPTLTIFKPKKPNGTTIVVFPGGGYEHLSINKEGYKVALWLNSLGITAIVLKYRLPSNLIMENPAIGPLQDAQESIKFVRRNAEKLNISINKIGVIGFSAGGHLAASLSTLYNDKIYESKDNVSAMPDFAILVYPVISMDDKISHTGSKSNLLGSFPSKELLEKLSIDKQVNAETPPTFLVAATDDKSVPVENSINYYLALKNNQVSTEMHLYEKGGHGFGLGKIDTSENWTKQCELWLKMNHYLD